MMTVAATGAHDPVAVPLPSSFADFDLGAEAIARRFDWARRQGHPRYLWPDVSPPEWRSALRAIERAVARLLAGDERVRLDLPTGIRPTALGIAAYTSGLGPWLGRACETGRLATTPPIGSVLAAHRAHNRGRAARLRLELERVLQLLLEVDARPVLLKSAHTMFAHFEEPGLRPCTDLDIAVAPESFRRASDHLRSAGYTPSTGQKWPRRCDFFPPDAPRALRSLDLVHAGNPYTVELHDSIDRAFHGVRTIAIPEDALTENGSPYAGARVLAPQYLAIYLALHAAEELYHLQLLRIVELNAVAQSALKTTADWEELARVVRSLAAGGFVFPAFALLDRLCPGTVPRTLLREWGKECPARVQRLLAKEFVSDLQQLETLSAGQRFLWVSTPAQAARRLAFLALGSSRPLARVSSEWAFGLLRRRSS